MLWLFFKKCYRLEAWWVRDNSLKTCLFLLWRNNENSKPSASSSIMLATFLIRERKGSNVRPVTNNLLAVIIWNGTWKFTLEKNTFIANIVVNHLHSKVIWKSIKDVSAKRLQLEETYQKYFKKKADVTKTWGENKTYFNSREMVFW